jgi:hypothetical protein
MVEKKRAKKPQEIVPLMLRLRETLRQRLAKDAEKALKSLNAEIVDRLEASYTKDERVEELRARLEEMRQSVIAARAAYEKDRDHFSDLAEDRRREIEELRAKIVARSAKFQSEITALEAEAGRLEAAEAIFDALVGEDVASKEAARGVALLLAANPGWAGNAEGVQKIAQSIGAIIQAAVAKGVQQ